MRSLLKARIDRAFGLTEGLVVHLVDTDLRLDLPGLPSNRISGQLWCMVGARESYIAAIVAGAWQGFSCSLSSPDKREAVLAALQATAGQLAALDFERLSEQQLRFAFELLEHEVQHHGQLIRLVYGNKLSFPESWHQRYTV